MVAREPNRTFTVQAGDKRIIALRTVFDVRYRRDGSIEVTLLEGKVEVSTAPGAPRRNSAAEETGSRSVILEPGERLVAKRLALPAIFKSNIATDTSWRALLERLGPLDSVARANQTMADAGR